MATRLIQKLFPTGRQEFQITDQAVQVRIKTLFKEKDASVMLSNLDPVPAIEEPYLHFHGWASDDPLLSLRLNKPNPTEFDAFVDELKNQARAAAALAGPEAAKAQPALGGNSFDDPPEDTEPQQTRVPRIQKNIDTDRVDGDIRMLRQYVETQEIEPLISALEALKSDPRSESNQVRVVAAFNDLGLVQGAVLTYAPYIGILLSDNVLGDS